jgi:hypothetical protein
MEIVQTDPAKVKNRNAREDTIARKHHTWKIPLWSAVGNLLSRRARAEYSASGTMLELAKGFEPLTL